MEVDDRVRIDTQYVGSSSHTVAQVNAVLDSFGFRRTAQPAIISPGRGTSSFRKSAGAGRAAVRVYAPLTGTNWEVTLKFQGESCSSPNLPPEPPRSSSPQGSGSDIPGIEVLGTGTTTHLSVWNGTTSAVNFQAGTWFEPKDGQYQRMIIAQSTSVPSGRTMRVPAACMQRANPEPAVGARFYSRPKSASGPVQSCQRRCLSGSSQSIQSCVWDCERSPTRNDPQPQGSRVLGIVVDQCNDGYNIEYRFFQYDTWRSGNVVAGDSRSGVWPSSSRVWTTQALGNRATDHALACTPGKGVCYGARRRGANDNRRWGAGIDGDQNCRNCCVQCPSTGTTTLRKNLTCN